MISTITWRDFKLDPPYDAYEDDRNGLETDFVEAWFVYRYTNRDSPGLHVSYKACTFSNGVFEPYLSHMRTSPYPEDRIEVIAWCSAGDIREAVLNHYKEETE